MIDKRVVFKLNKWGLLSVLFLSLSLSAMASGSDTAKFNAGEMLMGHVQDQHEIHVGPVTIPLPVILYTDKGIDVFSSGNFLNHDTHKATEAYTSAKTGYTYSMKENKVVEASGASIMDFSITKNVIGIILGMILMFWIFLTAAKGYKKREGQAPKGIQSVVEPIIMFIRDEVAKPSIGHKYERYLPFLFTLFFFIWIGNLLGLIPFLGGLNVTGNIAVTMVLALLTLIMVVTSANKGYWTHIINTPGVPWWLKLPVPMMPLIEIIGFLSKPFVLMLRLFANITAGHIIILSFAALIFIFSEMAGTGTGYGVGIATTLFSVFMNTLELLVAFLQAYVFTLLAAIYIGQAVEEAH